MSGYSIKVGVLFIGSSGVLPSARQTLVETFAVACGAIPRTDANRTHSIGFFTVYPPKEQKNVTNNVWAYEIEILLSVKVQNASPPFTPLLVLSRVDAKENYARIVRQINKKLKKPCRLRGFWQKIDRS
jgi:hypothetical protein